MVTKPLTTAALGYVLALAGGCATAPRALDGGLAYYRLPPPATLAVTPPTRAASPASTEARALAMRAVSREVDGDHEGALNDLREALVVEKDPARRASLENLLHKLEGAR
jgi:electron transfer flavoprotein alpha/beta subunit